jgi:hypothetical protein
LDCQRSGTYPVLARAVAPGQGKIARDGGCLYAANTAGAVLGALLTSFALLPGLGVQASALVAAGINAVQVAAEGERLLGFYEAGLYAYAGQRERWASALRRVLADDGNNPYYRWIIDGQQPAP